MVSLSEEMSTLDELCSGVSYGADRWEFNGNEHVLLIIYIYIIYIV